ncbi:NAD-dependent epimerase/dehydratase family protein, partial [Turicimonas muris]
MRNVLIIGSTGQIGTELTAALREHLGKSGTVYAGYTKCRSVPEYLQKTGPSVEIDILDRDALEKIVETYQIDTIYNLAAVLSATAEKDPVNAWHVGIDGLLNVLEVARKYNCAVFTPSSIGAFGPSSPKVNTPQDCVMRPTTIYGVSKVTGELLSDYYFKRFGVDTRSVRFPGLISYTTPPGGGTTDYAVDIFYSAVEG